MNFIPSTHLAQLHTHLIIRVDPPDRSLHMNLVLIHRDQRRERPGSQLLEHYRVGGLVALEDLGFDQCSVLGLSAELFDDLCLGLSKSKSPGGISTHEAKRRTELRTQAGQRSWIAGSRDASRQKWG